MEETKMPPDQQTSFIPKKPVTAPEPAPRARSSAFFSFLATIIFFASIAAAGGVYFYKASLLSQIADMSATLERSKSAFEPSLITDLQNMDKRLTASREILSKHITVSPIFKSLEELTLKSVRFTKFAFGLSADAPASPAAGSRIEVKMSGQTSPQGGYRSIALQSNKLSENKYFKDIVFSNLSLTLTGGVSFDLTFTVDPNFLLYEKIVSQQATI